MIKNLFSFGRNRGVIFATLLVVITLGAAYFFVYVPNNQRALEEKQFRCLQNTAQNISDKIDNSLATLTNLMSNYEPFSKSHNNSKLLAYIKSYPTNNFFLTIDTNYVRPKTNPEPAPGTLSDTSIIFNDRTLSVHLIKNNACIGITYTFKQFIEPLLPQKIFDQYIVFRESDLIYQSFQSGITQLISDSLKKDKSAFNAEQVKDISLSGTTYKFFSQQLNLKAAAPITVVGLLSKDHYGEEKNKLPEQTVLFLLMLAIAGILALPWIKLYQMGSNDRMTAADGLFSLTVPMLLMSILFFAFFSYNASFRSGTPASEFMTRSLADSIKTRFSAEIENTYQVLTRAAAACSQKDTPVKPASRGKASPAKTISAWDTTKLKDITKGLSVNQVYQLDEKGMETENWTPGGEPPPCGDYHTRDYFTRLKTQKPFYMHGDRRLPFYLEPVTSRTANTFRTVLSVPSAKNCAPYTAISFNIKALYHPILTPGFLYSIINGRGEVLYSSDTTKQLNENLFVEFSENETIKAAINAHTDKLFETNYSGTKYTAYVSPFSILPYQVVIMEDQSFTSVRAINNFVFSFSMLFAFFVALAVELLIVFMVSIKRQSYKKHYFDLSWIGPNKKFNYEYNVALLANLVTILLLSLFLGFGRLSFLEALFMLFAASSLSYLLLNLLYARAYKNANNDQYNPKRNAIIALGVIVIAVNIAGAVVTDILHLLFFQAILAAALGALWYFYERHPSFKEWADRHCARDFCKSFSIMTFTRLIITSGLPVLLFYISSFNYQVRLGGRYRHSLFTKAIKQQYALTPDSIKTANIYRDGVWVKKDTFINTKPPITLGGDEHRASILFGLLTVNNNKLFTGLNEFDHAPKDGSWLYSSLFNAGGTTNSPGVTYHRVGNQQYFEVQSLALRYNLPNFTTDSNWYKGVAYWGLFVCALAGFWRLLHSVLRRLFALKLPADSYWEKIDELLLRNEKLNNLVFLIGP
ncbi:MAG: cache domain-containing protein, partial [Mucilaginibacter sp.]